MAPIRTTLIILFVSTLAISACTSLSQNQTAQTSSEETQGPLLNSERIRQKFGSYGIAVVQESEELRVSNLYSVEGGKKITRTLAVVFYPATIPSSMLAEHEKIKSGQSIGEVFKRNGWKIGKQNVYFGEIDASPDYEGVYSSMGESNEVNLALHIYQLMVAKDGRQYRYVTIAEVHHPDYLDLALLREINNAQITESELNKESIQSILDAVAKVMKNYKQGVSLPCSQKAEGGFTRRH